MDSSYITSAIQGAANDIDLKSEFDQIVAEYGWYMVARIFDLDKRSQYWNETLKEARNGPIWEYTDYLVKGRRVEIQRLTTEDMEKFGANHELGKIFFIKSELPLKREDTIFMIEESISELSVPTTVHALEKYNIEEVERKIEHGMIFNKCYCTYLTPRNDESIEGGFQVNNII